MTLHGPHQGAQNERITTLPLNEDRVIVCPLRSRSVKSEADDDADAPAVALVNLSAAKRYWPDESPIGHAIKGSNGVSVSIVGVVGDDDLRPDGGVDHLSLVEGERGLELHYWDQAFPVAPGTASGLHDDPQEVHARQHYELVDWHRADDDLNYRRFFAVNTLAAVRVEEPEVFAETHVEIARWFREGLVDGLRVAHPDGLRDPRGYLDDLARLTGGAYVLVEKILEPGERLPTSWACEGTTDIRSDKDNA